MQVTSAQGEKAIPKIDWMMFFNRERCRTI